MGDLVAFEIHSRLSLSGDERRSCPIQASLLVWTTKSLLGSRFLNFDISDEELADLVADLVMVRLECKVASVDEVDFSIGNVPAETLSTRRQEERIILFPNGE